jgi:uncharacterized delta-60 repeat protein
LQFDTVNYNKYPNNINFCEGNYITLDCKGRIIILGRGINNNSNLKLFIWRFNPDGIADESFGSHGIVMLDLPSFSDYQAFIFNGVYICTDWMGRILINVGIITQDVGYDFSIIYRIHDNGSFDFTFGNNGFQILDGIARGNNKGGKDIFRKIIIDEKKCILICGSSDDMNNLPRMVVCRLQDNGYFDHSFGDNGVSKYNYFDNGINNYGEAYSLIIDNKGKVLVTGTNYRGMIIWRYNKDGSPDQYFGMNGAIIYSKGDENYNSTFGGDIILDNNNRILVVGGTGSEKQRMTLWRYK